MEPEDKLDETIEASFPASDPPSNTGVTGIAARTTNSDSAYMEIKQLFDGQKGMFYIEQDGKRVAEMTYALSESSVMIIDHTGVSPSLEGQGIGRRLVAAGVDHARAKQLKIVPLCPFAKAEFQKHKNYADVYYHLEKP